MDLPVIGSHCSLSSCNVLDLLPIRCRCFNMFCRHHISPEAHHCSANLVAQTPPSPSFQQLQRCATEKCNRPSLESFVRSTSDEIGRAPATCPHCHNAFCVSHRHPESHFCSVLAPPPSNKNVAGHKLLAKHFPSSTSMPPSTAAHHNIIKIPTNPKKRTQFQKIELIKMRHRAVPADPNDKPSSVLVDQRLHVKVKLDDGGKEGIFWFRKNVGTGRALDLLAIHLGIPSADSSPRQLLNLSADHEARVPLRNDQPLSSQVEEGSSLVLV